MTAPGRKPPAEGKRRSAGKAVSVLLLPSERALIEFAALDGEPLAVTVRRLALEAADADRRLHGDK